MKKLTPKIPTAVTRVNTVIYLKCSIESLTCHIPASFSFKWPSSVNFRETFHLCFQTARSYLDKAIPKNADSIQGHIGKRLEFQTHDLNLSPCH